MTDPPIFTTAELAAATDAGRFDPITGTVRGMPAPADIRVHHTPDGAWVQLPIAEYILTRLYGAHRAMFARYLSEYYHRPNGHE